MSGAVVILFGLAVAILLGSVMAAYVILDDACQRLAEAKRILADAIDRERRGGEFR